MREPETFHVGRLRCHTLDAGRVYLDGGAMFGVVPKPLWQRRIAADDRNRIALAMRCMVIEHDEGLILVDTGLGDKESDKFRDIYGVDTVSPAGTTYLEEGLQRLGFSAGSVTHVINTHLHFDHAGGNTVRNAQTGMLGPRFPRARHWVQRRELEFANHTNERTAGSYLAQNFAPISEAGLWELIEGEQEILPGVTTLMTPGHVPFHQSILVSDHGETACFVADLIPTSAHLPLPWIMGYDLEPMVTLESKRSLLDRACDEQWKLVFEHDPEIGIGTPARDGKSFVLQ